MMKSVRILILLSLFFFQYANASRNENIFLIATGLGALSTYLSEVALEDEANLDFFAGQAEYYCGVRETSVLSQGFGIERRLANWFSVGLEFTTQEMFASNYGSFGVSINPQFKWFLFGNSTFSPYLAYTSGLFYATSEFPQSGTNFTFRLIYALGVEYKLSADQRVRLSIGHLHQSNNNLLATNPGYDGDGLALSYIWKW